MPGISLLHKGKLEILQFNDFQDGKITHGFTTRRGGVSLAPFDQLNMALHVEDQIDQVRINRSLVCTALGMNPEELVAGVQVHGKRVEVIGPEHRGRGALDYHTAIPDTDALITDVPGIPLSSYYADCVPILFYDPVKLCVGLAHAGWRGTVQRIAGATVEKMVEHYGCNPCDILAGIGPSIGPCCYQVDEPVKHALQDNFSYWEQLVTPVGPDRWLLDLWQTNKSALLDVGLMPQNITVSKVCTSCESDLFFSYRSHRGKTGRMASLIMIKK